MSDQQKPPFIDIEGNSKGEVWGNEIYDDRPLLRAKGNHELKIFDNVQASPITDNPIQPEPVASLKSRSFLMNPWVITIVGGILVGVAVKFL